MDPGWIERLEIRVELRLVCFRNIQANRFSEVVSQIEATVGIGRGSPRGSLESMLSSEFLEVITLVFAENDVSGVREHYQVVADRDNVTEISRDFLFPSDFSGVEVQCDQVSWVAITSIVGDDMIAEEYARLNF